MDNDKKVYAIRTLGFGYADEYYYPLFRHDSNEGHICAVFEEADSSSKCDSIKISHDLTWSKPA